MSRIILERCGEQRGLRDRAGAQLEVLLGLLGAVQVHALLLLLLKDLVILDLPQSAQLHLLLQVVFQSQTSLLRLAFQLPAHDCLLLPGASVGRRHLVSEVLQLLLLAQFLLPLGLEGPLKLRLVDEHNVVLLLLELLGHLGICLGHLLALHHHLVQVLVLPLLVDLLLPRGSPLDAI